MPRYTVAVPDIYWNRQAKSSDYGYIWSTMAQTRTEAFNKCLPSLRVAFKTMRPDVKVVSVLVGLSRERLTPIRVRRQDAEPL